MADTSEILFTKHDDVGLLMMNRPGTLNSFSGKMLSEMHAMIKDLSTNGGVRALVVSGAGRGFCSGADLSTSQPIEARIGTLGEAMKAGMNPFIMDLYQAPFPVIMAVNGPAAGAGAGIALAGDFLIASRSMKLMLTFSRLGLGFDAGTSWFLSRSIGIKRAAAISMLVEPIDADKALELGLAYSVEDDEVLVPKALEFAARLAAGPTMAFAAQKQQLSFAIDASLGEALDNEAEVQDRLIRSEDLQEGIAAFRERRSPQFSGR